MERTITDLVEYIEEVAPNLMRNALGANDDEVDELEDLVLTSSILYLPWEYKEFLYRMGNRQPVAFAFDAKMDMSSLKDTYRNFADANVSPPPDCIWIASKGYDVPQLALECKVDENEETQISGVATTDGAVKEFHINDGFLTFLYRRVFEIVECGKNSLTGAFYSESSEPVLALMSQTLIAAGWKNKWFSDSVTLSMMSPDKNLRIVVRQRRNEVAVLKIHGENKDSILSTAKTINSAVKLVTGGWYKNEPQ